MLTDLEILGPHGADREDDTNDQRFYAPPRMVAHIDDSAIAAATETYLSLLAPNMQVLDLMSSRFSHLPDSLPGLVVTGLGMNAAELRANPQLTHSVVQNLNETPTLPFADATFDLAINTVSVQYLRKPVTVFSEVARVLKPGAPYAVAFSNRMFPTKAIRAWREGDEEAHIALVTQYFTATSAYSTPQVIRYPGKQGNWPRQSQDPLYIVIGRRAEKTAN